MRPPPHPPDDEEHVSAARPEQGQEKMSPVEGTNAAFPNVSPSTTHGTGIAPAMSNTSHHESANEPSGACVNFVDRGIFHIERPMNINDKLPPLARETRRYGEVVPLPATPATGSGSGYRNHIPLTARVRINGTDNRALPCLLDTGASLSVVDASLLQRLGGRPQGQPMAVHGLGDTATLGWITMTVFIDSTGPHGKHVHLEFQQDFHVLPRFAPGLCLGQDFISSHDVTISPARGRARIGHFTFEVTERVEGPYGKDIQLITAEDTVLEPGFQSWVPVSASSLVPDVDYIVAPRLSVTPDETVRLAGPTGMMSHRPRAYVLLGNYGSTAHTLGKGTIVADAVAARMGDVAQPSGETFSLTPSTPTGTPYVGTTAPAAASDDDSLPGVPLDVFADTEDAGSSLVQDAATTMIDDVFRVGVDSAGRAPSEVVDLLRRHKAAFALDGRPGRVEGFDMGIPLRPDANLRPEAPRRASPEKRQAMDAAIDQLLDWDVIEPSHSSVSFPVLMVKQQTKWRFCVDYRQLNTHTIPDRYPLPTIDSVFQTLSGKTWFSALDAIRGYHQLGVKPEDRWKTAFVCHRGLYQYKMVPFGLRNAPSVFQRLMDHILGPLRWQQAVIYIDDSIVATDTLEEHLAALDTLLSSAEKVGLKFSPSKCTFAVPSLVLLGRKVSGAGIAVWKDRASAVAELSRPSTLQELYHVLGLFGYYRAFVHKFAEVAAPLTRLLRGWRYETSDGQSRLVNAEGKATVASRVPIPWAEEQQLSFDRLKAAISQPPVLAHPNPAHPYILYVDASKDAYAAILHQVCIEDDASDPVASPPVSPTAATMSHLAVSLLPSTVARARWDQWIRDDPTFGPIARDLRASPESSDDWVLRDGILMRRLDDRLALPAAGLPAVLKAVHDRGGHFGFTKTFLAISRHFWRPGLSTAVRAWVKHCGVCQRTKSTPKTGSLDIDHDASAPFERISIDLMLGLPLSRSGNDAALAILDMFSRMILLTPCHHTITADGIVAIVSDRVLRMGWRPRRIVSDSEARMSGARMTALAESLGAELTPSTPYHQQANAVERSIQTAQKVLQALSVDSAAHWDKRALPSAELAINSSPSVTTGYRPFDLVFIAHPSIVHAVFDDSEHLGVASFPERLAAAAERMKDAKSLVDAARREQKRRYDSRRASPVAISAGDQVFVRLSDRPIPGTIRSKLDARKQGPFTVAEVLSPHRIRLTLPDDVAIDPIMSIEQVDLVPSAPDPFAGARAPSPGPAPASDGSPFSSSSGSSSAPDIGEPPASAPSSVSSPPLAPRVRRPPLGFRDFHVGTVQSRANDQLAEALRGPLVRPRSMQLDGRMVRLVERPVAYLSRLTSPAERKLVASELELSCLAWAFAKLAHLLEGAEVTVITDHSSMEKMLQSTAAIHYGPTISRCRALLMPHLPNLHFRYRPGPRHNNVDALSRLIPDPGRSASAGGDVLDSDRSCAADSNSS
ncbi:hypothetical protein A4X13_0g7663 [Tilletia indica]|uniref:RNA-directed DNA polymerase n=1 Tax=Tilletia indica TaxID=43049 RepID=A0A177TD83_9BASI|nr:hypothetical protein A4X13_0g7663 [Tilletia indica]